MPYPHVTQFETVDLRVALAARRAVPGRVLSRKALRRLARRRAADCAASA